MSMQKTVLMAVLAVLCFPVSILAETTNELIDRLAKQAQQATKNNPWVKPTDCQAEQEAVRQRQCYSDVHKIQQKIQQTLEAPWVYRYGGKDDPSGLRTANELRREAEDSLKSAQKNDRWASSGGFNQGGYLCEAAYSRLLACAYRIAATRRDSAATVSPAAAKAKLESQCAPDAVASANRELQEIDQRLAAFLESPAGQQTGTVTPSLQVIMWGTREQVRIMKRYCPKADAFQERIDTLMSSFQSAQQACRTIQSDYGPKNCEPAAPQALIASYDKAQREAASNYSVPTSGDSSSSASVSQSGNKSSSSESGCGPSGKGVCWAR